ncbi:MAG: V/A-type H+/Na+-transporting ATPase subunit [Candidatus Atribacteria bacterium]|nr:V/A-type H+/Na+-transporting ATPase subunit [Candidatus Atribacteria bacterium]
MPVREYLGLSRIYGPLVVVKGVEKVGYEELVEVVLRGEKRLGQVVFLEEDQAVIQVFEGTAGLTQADARVRFLGRPVEISLSQEVIGRVFDGLGRPIDQEGEVIEDVRRDVYGEAINPYTREYPRNFIQTGISAIDGMATLIRGQKLPIFSGAGLPHNRLVVQITRQAKIAGGEKFVVVFCGIGLKHDEAEFIQSSFEETGAMKNVVMVLNLADDPSVERITTPQVALTIAEYLAFDQDMHVLAILTDMTNYCETLREISNYRGEVPARKGYPGYMYSDLASIYERTGMIKGRKGSLTQIPVVTMPNDDITHPIPDLTGYITEGQIVLGRELHRQGIYPPISILPSLSRLMKDGIGEGFTRPDHPNLASQLFASYGQAQNVRSLASIIGEEELSEADRNYLDFARKFESQFINQDFSEERSMEETLNLGWAMLAQLPPSELNRVTREEINQFLQR